ncbi:hypothetical protein ABMB44_00010 [Levilactobacillus brevis]|uniref:hypothetical protein n=1 Tax=Levilactobacillus brevis TaxID=1580 RepID=UPI0021A2ED71|nr:hypothetical protein [Levilactobacillus brevis]
MSTIFSIGFWLWLAHFLSLNFVRIFAWVAGISLVIWLIKLVLMVWIGRWLCHR